MLTTDEEVGPFGQDASRATLAGRPLGVVTATSTDVSQALRWASAHGVPVSVRGSGTGLTGGAVSAEGLRVSSDVAVPIARLADMFTAIERFSRDEAVAIPTFAHAGDGNLHPSVIVDPADPAARDLGETSSTGSATPP